MLEIKVKVEAPELAAALNSLAAAMGGAKAQTCFPINSLASTQPTSTAPSSENAPAHTPQQPSYAPPIQPPMQTQMQAPAAPVQMQPQPPAPVNGVPLAPPPQYAVDQIMAAGATLMDAGRVNDLMNLLHSFGVQAVMDLKPEQLGAFATALRDLGEKI